MARKAQYTKSLPVYVTPRVRDYVNQIATDYEVSQAEVVRLLIDLGMQVAKPATLDAAFPRED